MAPPLAGKPPFATDEPDSYYDDKDANAPRRRAPPPKPDNPNKRTSAYDVYDTYLTANGSSPSPSDARPASAVSTTSRNSGIGGIGMGLLAMDSDSDDDSDDEEAYERRRKAEQAKRNAASNAAGSSSPDPSKGGSAGGGNSRTAALAAAIHANTPSPPNSPPPSPPPPSPKPIAAPKPGYAAPTIATLGVKSPAPSEGENPFEPQHHQHQQQQQQQGRSPFDNPPQQGMRGPPMPHPQHQHPQQQQLQQRGPPMPAPIHGMPQPMQPHRQDSGQSMTSGSSHGGFRGPPPGLGLNTSGLLPPNGPGGGMSPHSPITPPPGAMVRGMAPAPLAPPMTPIMPVFAVPTASGSPGPGEKGGVPGVKWDESAQPIPRKPIMRSNTEDALLPRRGEKGDDFWRRFSMVAHLEEKAPGGKGGGSMWLRKTQSGTSRLSKWVWFIGLILLGAIGAAIGLGVYFTKDKPDHQQPVALSGEVGTQKADATSSVGKNGGTGSGASTVKHVSPTHTIDARAWVEAVVTPIPVPVVGAGTLVYRNVNVEERGDGGGPCPKATATNASGSGSGVHHREVLEREEEGRARREHVKQSTSRKRRF